MMAKVRPRVNPARKDTAMVASTKTLVLNGMYFFVIVIKVFLVFETFVFSLCLSLFLLSLLSLHSVAVAV